jgi:hypothetical protein
MSSLFDGLSLGGQQQPAPAAALPIFPEASPGADAFPAPIASPAAPSTNPFEGLGLPTATAVAPPPYSPAAGVTAAALSTAPDPVASVAAPPAYSAAAEYGGAAAVSAPSPTATVQAAPATEPEPPLERLRKARMMLSEGLIEQAEFDEVKKTCLAQLKGGL